METEFLAIAEEAAREAGRILLDWAGRFSVREKSPANLVTEADFASQEAIHRRLHERFPEHGFLGEEGLQTAATDSDFRWVVDPLDGTQNYVHGFPYYAVSIGLEYQRRLVVGVVYDPNRNEMFSAASGRGATLNGARLQTTRVDELKQAMLVASLPVAPRGDDPAVARFLRVMPHAQTVQRTGSAALNLAYVASGRIEGFWSSSLMPWDMAAGALLVREAGGRVTRMDGSEFDIETPDLLASNGAEIHAQLQRLLT